MEVTRTANGLTVNIPDDVAKSLNLKVGDAVKIVPVEERAQLQGKAEGTQSDPLGFFFSLNKQLPADWKFDRNEANERS